MKSNTHSHAVRTVASALALMLAAAGFTSAQAPGITIHPSKGSLARIWAGKPAISVTFPTPMVDIDKRGVSPCPLVFDPPIDVHWAWVSQTEGRLVPPIDHTPAESGGVLLRRVMYRANLRPGMRDLTGQPVAPRGWGVQFADDVFALSGVEFLNAPRPEERRQPEWIENVDAMERAREEHKTEKRGEKESLPARPRVRIEFSRDVVVKEAERNVYFQDAASGEKFPVEATIEGLQRPTAQGWVIVEPIRPLPPERTFHLVVERFAEPAEKKLLPVQKIIPAGTTYPMTIKVIAGFHQPAQGVFVRIRASKPFEPGAAAGAITVEPPVPDLKLDHSAQNGRTIDLRGKFDPKTVYKVTVKAGVKSVDQFALAKDSVWTVRFPQKRPAVVVRDPMLFQRPTATGIRVQLVQVNTGKLSWKIAAIPAKQLLPIRKKLREFGEFVLDENQLPLTDPEKGEHLVRPTKLFIPTVLPEVLAAGSFDASGDDRETPREVRWTPASREPGVYLLEISGRDAQGRTIGNRSIISRGDWVITEIETSNDYTVRLASMSDGRPVPGVPIQVFTRDGIALPASTTDAHGEARFDRATVVAQGEPALILAGKPGQQCVQFPGQPTFPGGSVAYEDEAATERGIIVTDRNLYRPGETVRFKGIMRRVEGDRLTLPVGNVEWNIVTGPDGGEIIHTATAPLSPTGSWEGTWQVPGSLLGGFAVRSGRVSAEFGVAEFRPLPFSVTVESADTHGDTVAARISSAHFHGAANARAKVRWKAVWLIKDSAGIREEPVDFDAPLPAIAAGPAFRPNITDEYSPDSPTRGVSADLLGRIAKAGWDVTHGTGQSVQVSQSDTVQGEAMLDEAGALTLTCKSPFRPGVHRRAEVTWLVDVLSEAGQSVRGGASARVQFAPNILGVLLRTKVERKLFLNVVSLDVADQFTSGMAAKAELFHLTVKTVKEPVGSGISRYRNFPEFKKVWEGNVVTPAEVTIPVTASGHYVMRVTAPGQPLVPQVSATAMMAGDDVAAMPVESETGLIVKADRERYSANDTATIAIEAPFTGVATVSVATDRVLARQVVELKGNAQRIPLKIQPEFAPNAHVTVHLIKAAGADGPPAERFGSCVIGVDRPDRQLQVTVEVAAASVEPDSDLAGMIRVRANGQPVTGAEVLIFAADDAILSLGRWEMPRLDAAFFPERALHIATHSAGLDRYGAAAAGGVPSLGQKGFILGGSGLLKGGPDAPFRRYYRPFDFWKATERTDAAGEVRFKFKTPDVLTRCRLIAVAHHGAEAFGAADKTVLLAKRLQIEPVLPDFVRRGDEVLLRATVQQDYAATDDIDIKLERLGTALQPVGEVTRRETLKRGERRIVTFRAKVIPGPASARILFTAASATQPTMRDTEDNTVPVRPAEIELRESLPGTLAAATPFDIAGALPPRWRDGSCDVLLSGSPYLAKLAGLPAMIEARGSLEKLSTRILAGTLLAETLKFLPLTAAGEKSLRSGIEESIRLFDQSKLADGRQPCWPGASEAHDFVTLQTAWAILNAKAQGFVIKDSLTTSAKMTLRDFLRRTTGFERTPADLRCLAFMILARTESEDEENVKDLLAEADGIYDARHELSDEGRAWLALGLHYFKHRPPARDTLLKEIDRPTAAGAFDPATFSSQTRGEAVRLLAQSEIGSASWSVARRKAARETLDRLTQTSVDLSTQENLWLLLAFNSMTRGEISPALGRKTLTPKPTQVSQNMVSVGWLGVPLANVSTQFPAPLQTGVKGSYLLRATYPQSAAERRAPDPSLSLARSVRNLTDPARTGTAEAPWKLGDHILVTFALQADRPHSYLEIEDQLPACLETVNSQLPLIAQFFKFPIETGANTLALSNAELRTDRTVLYFDRTKPGRNIYSILSRVGVAGTFRWPCTQVRPMYDSRFGGVSEAAVVQASE